MDNNLNDPYPMTNIDEAYTTKERILLEATNMFAKSGADSVSIRDIAEKVEICPAAIYNHYESKEVLWDAVLERIKTLYLLYFERLDGAVAKAGSFKEVVDCMFAELFQVVDIFTYRGFSLVQSEQIRDKKAYEIYSDIFMRYSIDFISNKFDICIQNGWAKEFDTKAVATIFMHNVLIGIIMRSHEEAGHNVPYDVSEMFEYVHRFVYQSGAGE